MVTNQCVYVQHPKRRVKILPLPVTDVAYLSYPCRSMQTGYHLTANTEKRVAALRHFSMSKRVQPRIGDNSAFILMQANCYTPVFGWIVFLAQVKASINITIRLSNKLVKQCALNVGGGKRSMHVMHVYRKQWWIWLGTSVCRDRNCCATLQYPR